MRILSVVRDSATARAVREGVDGACLRQVDAAAGVATALQRSPQVVVVDLAVDDALAVIAEARARPDAAGPAIVALSASHDRADHAPAYRAGADEVVCTPFAPQVLTVAVGRLLMLDAGARARRRRERLALSELLAATEIGVLG